MQDQVALCPSLLSQASRIFVSRGWRMNRYGFLQSGPPIVGIAADFVEEATRHVAWRAAAFPLPHRLDRHAQELSENTLTSVQQLPYGPDLFGRVSVRFEVKHHSPSGVLLLDRSARLQIGKKSFSPSTKSRSTAFNLFFAIIGRSPSALWRKLLIEVSTLQLAFNLSNEFVQVLLHGVRNVVDFVLPIHEAEKHDPESLEIDVQDASRTTFPVFHRLGANRSFRIPSVFANGFGDLGSTMMQS